MTSKTLIPKGTMVWVHNPEMTGYEVELIKEHGPIWVVKEYGSCAYVCQALTSSYEWAWYARELITEGEYNADKT